MIGANTPSHAILSFLTRVGGQITATELEAVFPFVLKDRTGALLKLLLEGYCELLEGFEEDEGPVSRVISVTPRGQTAVFQLGEAFGTEEQFEGFRNDALGKFVTIKYTSWVSGPTSRVRVLKGDPKRTGDVFTGAGVYGGQLYGDMQYRVVERKGEILLVEQYTT